MIKGWLQPIKSTSGTLLFGHFRPTPPPPQAASPRSQPSEVRTKEAPRCFGLHIIPDTFTKKFSPASFPIRFLRNLFLLVSYWTTYATKRLLLGHYRLYTHGSRSVNDSICYYTSSSYTFSDF